MAVITPSALINEIRGSVGDQTFSRNRYGAYVKQKLVQPASNTPAQEVIRDAMAAGVSAWRLTPPATKLSWDDYVNEKLRKKNISRTVRISAFNEFCGRYVNRAIVEGSNSGFRPDPVPQCYPYLASITQAPGSIDLDWISLITPTNSEFVIYATPPLSATIRSINKSAFKVLSHFTPSGNSGSHDIFTAYDAEYPLTGADVGKRIGIAIKSVNTSNYAGSSTFYTDFILSSAVVTAIPSITQKTITNLAGSSTTRTVSLGSAPTLDSLVVLFINLNTQPTITNPSGFTTLFTIDQGLGRTRCCYKIAGASEPSSYSFTLSAASSAYVAALEIINANTTTPIYDYDTNNGSASIANPCAASDISCLDGSLALAGILAYDGGMTFTSLSNSFTQVDVADTARVQFAEREYASAAANVNTVWDWVATRNFVSFVMAISPG